MNYLRNNFDKRSDEELEDVFAGADERVNDDMAADVSNEGRESGLTNHSSSAKWGYLPTPTMDWRVQGNEDKQVNPKNGSMLSFLDPAEDCILEMRKGC